MSDHRLQSPVHIAVITGSRADFGLLRPVMHAISAHDQLTLSVIVTGTHLIGQTRSVDDVACEFPIEAQVPMQQNGVTGRAADVAALARGVAGFGIEFDRLQPDVVLVLGDRIEAFAAATAGSVGGQLVAHIHGGDRAEGVADEAMRHAITKLAHLHFPATPLSAERLRKMGENPRWIHTVGSPAIDDLKNFDPLDNESLSQMGLNPSRPFAVVLHHPTGLEPEIEQSTMQTILNTLEKNQTINQYLLMAPNHDPGRESILKAINERKTINHLPRNQFIGLLKRSSVMVGNSSAGLIEAAALPLPVVNIGPRQAGRERGDHVIDVNDPINEEAITHAINQATTLSCPSNHPYGRGDAGVQIANHLADLINDCPPTRKRNAY